MAAFNRVDARLLAQDYIGESIHSRLYKIIPLFYMLTGMSGPTKSNAQIGIPNTGEVFSGAKISAARKEDLAGFNSYQVALATSTTDASKIMGARDTNPTYTNPQTQSDSQGYGSAAFNLTELKTPILIWKSDLDKALGPNVASKARAVENVVENAVNKGLANHLTNWAHRFWYGNPSNQASDPWDDLSGLISALSDSNTYGNVDRTNPAASSWRSNVVTKAFAADPFAILNDANLNQNAAITGAGIDFMICNQAKYAQIKQSLLGKTGVILQNGMPGMAEYGYKREVINVDGAYLIYDPMCPVNTVVCLNLEYWKVIINSRYNFVVTDFTDLGAIEGGKDAWQAFVDTKMILACEEPAGQVIYTNVN